MWTILLSLRLAWRTLMQNKVRSVLTLLGMIIGVGAVIAIVSLGEGLRADFEGQMASLGSDVFYMTPVAPKRPGQAARMPDLFNMDDMEAIETHCPRILHVVPGIMTGATVKYREKTRSTTVTGADEKYLTYSVTARIEKGRFFTKGEVKGAARLAVIGDEIADELFEEHEDPVGAVVKLNGVTYQVIGKLAHYSGMISEGGNINTSLIAPITTVQKRMIGTDDIFWVSLYLEPGADLSTAKDNVAALMRQRRRIRNVSDDDFQFISPDDFKEIGNQFINVMVSIFGGIAFISLLVGGVGIMNIMLVSVTERTREIGLRMALGAGRAAVLTQFMVEAILLTLLGGLIGLGIGYTGALGVAVVLENLLETNWTPHIPAMWVGHAVFVSALVGIVFGVYPAFKASQLDPVEAMRYE